MTYSIVAFDAKTKQFGVAVQTHQPSVGAVVPWVMAGVGAIATQSLTNISFGPLGIELMQGGVSAEKALAALLASDPGADQRQVSLIDREGKVATHTGKHCIPFAGHHIGENYSVQANMMLKDTVPTAMAKAYEEAQGDLMQRMMIALEAAEGGAISAALNHLQCRFIQARINLIGRTASAIYALTNIPIPLLNCAASWIYALLIFSAERALSKPRMGS